MTRAGIAAASAAVAWGAPALAAHSPALCRALRLPRTVDAPDDGVLLTFDDGPHPHGTPAVLRALDEAGAHAVFFVVGEQLARDDGPARAALAAGHELAIHGEVHRCAALRTPRALRDDLDRVAERVGGLTGVAPRLYRPPFGIATLPLLADVRRRGWTPLLWSAWGRDWRRSASPSAIADLVLRDCAPGGVVLLHDADDYSSPGSWERTAAALPAILEGLAQRGLRPSPPAATAPRL